MVKNLYHILTLFFLISYTQAHLINRNKPRTAIRRDYLHQPKKYVAGIMHNGVTQWEYRGKIQLEDERGFGVVYNSQRKQYFTYSLSEIPVKMEPEKFYKDLEERFNKPIKNPKNPAKEITSEKQTIHEIKD